MDTAKIISCGLAGFLLAIAFWMFVYWTADPGDIGPVSRLIVAVSAVFMAAVGTALGAGRKL